MKILKIQIINYKKLKVFEQQLNGENLEVVGKTGVGKTTAISALWDIIEKVGDPLTHGEKNGKIHIVLGDEKKKVFATRKFTDKTNQVIIMTSEGEKISVADFKSWFNSLGINPHKIMDMKPLEQTQTLLNTVELPKGVDLDNLDKQRNETADKRKVKGQLLDIAKKSIGDEPEKVEPINTKGLMQQLNEINAYNNKIETAENKALDIIAEIERENNEIESLESQIKSLSDELESFKTSVKELQDKKKIADNWLQENKKKDTSPIEDKINSAEETNSKILLWEKWNENKNEAEKHENEYKELDKKVKDFDKMKKDVIANAKWPVAGLSVKDGNIVYNDCLLSNCGHSEQMLVCGALAAASIKDNELRVVRMDGIESMSPEDFKTLQKIFNDKGIQVLSSRVSRGEKEENEIVIEEM